MTPQAGCTGKEGVHETCGSAALLLILPSSGTCGREEVWWFRRNGNIPVNDLVYHDDLEMCSSFMEGLPLQGM